MTNQVIEPPVADGMDGVIEEGDLVPVADRFLAERPQRYEDITESIISQSGTSATHLREQAERNAEPEVVAIPSASVKVGVGPPAPASSVEGELPAVEAKKPEVEEKQVPAKEEQNEETVTRGRRRRRRR